jgi:magnesium chelatase family protein
LFLDELTLYRRDVLEALRGPLEDGGVTIARSGGTVTFPCRFSLVAAMNPCPCGYLGDSRRPCSCSARTLDLYRARLSGPMLDRFDLHVTMGRPDRCELLGEPSGDGSEVVRHRVVEARRRQGARYGSAGTTNATCSKGALERGINLTSSGRAVVEIATDALVLSGHGLDRVLRVARTIADLEGWETTEDDHVAEALSLRAPDSADEDVTRKKGIYTYVLDGQEKHLNIRAFSPNQRREAYERQKGICPVCEKHFEFDQMEADHITPWRDGGKTSADNCQMLCRDDNRRKGGI